jgi:hypothetical protein
MRIGANNDRSAEMSPEELALAAALVAALIVGLIVLLRR